MKTKKILSFVMALAMALSIASTALASDTAPAQAAPTSLEHAARYAGDTTVPTINLALSAVNTALAFNPYKLAVKVDANGVPNAEGNNTMNDQLITKEITITNLTNVPLKMEGSLTVTTSLGTGAPATGAEAATLSNKALSATETAKKLYVYADFYAYDGAYSDLPERTKTAALTHRLVAATSGTAVTHTSANRVVLQATPGVQQNADDNEPNYVYVKVNGEATNAPEKPWETYDKVQIDLMFSFQSQPNVNKYAVVDKANATASADFTVKPTYCDEAIIVTKGNDTTDLAAGVTAKAIPGSICYIIPATGKKITAVKFYDKTGTSTITTVKAASTDTKTPTAPWSFTMPTDNVFMEVTIAAVT